MATTKLTDKELVPTRDIKKLLRDRVQFLPGHVGLVLSDYTTMAENLQILDWTIGLGEHVQFWIGDVLNAGYVAYGNKYAEALKRTNRAHSTLRQYASVARRIPVEKRKATLSFWHHEVIVRMSEQTAVDKLLDDAAAKAEKGQAPTVKELRDTVKQAKSAAPDEQTDATELDDITEELRPRKRHKSQKQIEKELQRKKKQEQEAEKEANDELAAIIKKLNRKVKAAWPEFPGHLAAHGKALSELAARLVDNP
jgi:lysyl-tRNA synthetase class I